MANVGSEGEGQEVCRRKEKNEKWKKNKRKRRGRSETTGRLVCSSRWTSRDEFKESNLTILEQRIRRRRSLGEAEDEGSLRRSGDSFLSLFQNKVPQCVEQTSQPEWVLLAGPNTCLQGSFTFMLVLYITELQACCSHLTHSSVLTCT